ncbi:MAG: glycosyltransferase [Acidobacteriota bacterium]|nr:glycosyltransferase [Acidobacteriota bacterium]
MTQTAPMKVLITGGDIAGGLASFAEALRAGFEELGITAEVIPPRRILFRWRDLRNSHALKIFSTTAVFAAPFSRRSICVAHGFPRADAQGWIKLLGIIASFKLATRSSLLATVSHYAAVHLRTIFGLRVDAVIHNPLHRLFLEHQDASSSPRDYITYVGRLHPCKRLDRIFPAICALVKATPNLRACIIGGGELSGALEAAAGGDPRIEFTGPLPREQVRAWLRRTKVFVSGCETEALGISYLEALSQGCIVAMPACGGGLEIAPDLIGRSIRLLPLSWEQGAILSTLREAFSSQAIAASLTPYSAAAVAASYLELDRQRLARPMAPMHGAGVHG